MDTGYQVVANMSEYSPEGILCIRGANEGRSINLFVQAACSTGPSEELQLQWGRLYLVTHWHIIFFWSRKGQILTLSVLYVYSDAHLPSVSQYECFREASHLWKNMIAFESSQLKMEQSHWLCVSWQNSKAPLRNRGWRYCYLSIPLLIKLSCFNHEDPTPITYSWQCFYLRRYQSRSMRMDSMHDLS